MPVHTASDSELSDFLMRACHDLRSPLRAIRIHSELMSRHCAQESASAAEQSLAFVTTGVSSANAVLDGIADYALALAIDPVRFQPVPLDVMLRAALGKLASRIRESQAEVEYEGIPTLPGDADRLLQLFEYLVDHALRHCKGNRPGIQIAAELENGAWLFTFRDNCGAAVECTEGVLKPFARLYANQRPGPGLAVCREIVERHGGRMWAETESGAGCVFRFTLPAE
jgi:light-regulated signal transduction histidine kinase (bacteriophytochrome)